MITEEVCRIKLNNGQIIGAASGTEHMFAQLVVMFAGYKDAEYVVNATKDDSGKMVVLQLVML